MKCCLLKLRRKLINCIPYEKHIYYKADQVVYDRSVLFISNSVHDLTDTEKKKKWHYHANISIYVAF